MPTSTTLSYAARIDSGSANNPALNLTGDAAVIITFAPETILGAQGDLLLEGDYATSTPDDDTVVYINGSAYEFSFTLSGNLPTLKSDGSQQVPDQFEGDSIYIITVYGYPAPGDVTRMTYMPGQQVDPTDPIATQAALDDMDAFGNGAIDVQAVNDPPPPTPVCFCAGTLIRTVTGELAVEDLAVGDLVCTDRGTLRIHWIGRSDYTWSAEADSAKPYVIPRDALGQDLPLQDLHVSPQHKLAFRDPDTGTLVLCPVVGLADWNGIRQRNGCRKASYFHILLERHAVVNANGLASESFFPGPMALKMVSAANRVTLRRALADPVWSDQPMAGRALTRREAMAHRQRLVPACPPGASDETAMPGAGKFPRSA